MDFVDPGKHFCDFGWDAIDFGADFVGLCDLTDSGQDLLDFG